MNPIIILSLAVFVGVVALIAAIVFVMGGFEKSSAEDRLDVLTGKKQPTKESDSILKEEVWNESLAGITNLFRSVIDRFNRLELLFEQANSPVKPEMFFGISIGFAILGIAGGFVANAPTPLYPVCAFMAGILPMIWLLWRRKRRFKAFAKQLPDALELVGRALRSGHSLSSGLHVVVEEMPDPISIEFSRAYEEQNLGIPLDKALNSMVDRMPNMDLKFFATAVAIQRTSGGDMAEILDKISYIIRERFQILGQVAALTGEGRISGVVLLGLPIALFFAVYYLNPDYMMLLFTEPLGHKMIALAAVLQVLGAVVIKKIIQIKI